MAVSIRRLLLAAAGAATLMAATDAHATLTLTLAAQSAGFQLSTFASGFPSTSGIGPISVGFLGGGKTMVSDWANSRLVIFPNDNDGQLYSSGTIVTSAGAAPTGIATIGGAHYVAMQNSGTVDQINNDGSLNHVVASGMAVPTGLAVNPSNGHLFVSAPGQQIYNLNPTTGAFTTFSGLGADGLTMSPDGLTLYAEAGGHIYGLNTTTAAFVSDSGPIPDSPDGAAAAVGSLAGNVFVNTNGGTLYEYNVASHTVTLIASGGSRGDLVTIDPSNGTLLLSQTDSVLRLTLPAGSSFTAPEPASLALLGLGVAGLGMLRRRRG